MNKIYNLFLATTLVLFSNSLINEGLANGITKGEPKIKNGIFKEPETGIILSDASTPVNPDNNFSDKDYIVILKNGTILPCKILEKSYKGLKIQTDNLGELFIPLQEVESIKEKKSVEDKTQINSSEELKKLETEKEKLIKKESEITVKKQLESEIKETEKHVESLEKGTKIYWFPNPNDTRYFFAPTARPLGKGNGYLQDIGVVIGGANYGIADNISIGGMASLIPFIDVSQQLLAFTPKLGFNITKNLSFGGGLVYISGAGLAQMGVLYGVTTFGSSDSNFSLAVGGAYGNISRGGAFKPVINQEIINGAHAFIGMLGGMHRIFETVSLISENWIIVNSVTPGNTYMFSYGFRFFGQASSWDLGIVYPVIPTITTFPIPYVDFVWDF